MYQAQLTVTETAKIHLGGGVMQRVPDSLGGRKNSFPSSPELPSQVR